MEYVIFVVRFSDEQLDKSRPIDREDQQVTVNSWSLQDERRSELQLEALGIIELPKNLLLL